MSSRIFALAVGFAGLVMACSGNQTSSTAGGAGAGECGAGKTGYQEHREELLAKVSQTTCTADADCAVLWETNACVSTCGTPAPASVIESATADLSAFAKKSCSSCPPIPIPPCAPPAPVTCQQGRCGGL